MFNSWLSVLRGSRPDHHLINRQRPLMDGKTRVREGFRAKSTHSRSLVSVDILSDFGV